MFAHLTCDTCACRKLLYEGSEWGWHERDKLKEMHAEGMHYFFVTAPVDSTASNSSSSVEGVSGAAENVGFASGNHTSYLEDR